MLVNWIKTCQTPGRPVFWLRSMDHTIPCSYNVSELFPWLLTCWILCRSLLLWSWIFQSPWPRTTAEYMPWVIIGARILSVCIVPITQTLSIVSWIVFCEHKAEYINSCPLFMHRSTILCIPGSIRSQGRKPRFLLEAGSIFSSFASSRTKLQIHKKRSWFSYTTFSCATLLI